jgi:hypothetical protein
MAPASDTQIVLLYAVVTMIYVAEDLETGGSVGATNAAAVR